MASDRKPELVIVDTLKDKHRRTVKIGHRGGDVEIIVTPHSGRDGRIALDAERRDRFIKAWADAERAIEREDAELECRRDAEAGPPPVGDDEAELLTYDQAVALLPDGDRVHTFLQAGAAIVGADWDREHVLDLLKTTGRREVTGATAQSMGHGLAAFREDGIPVFIATRPD